MNSSLLPFDYERLVIGHLLVYPDAAKYVFPHLDHRVFLYSKEGRLDSRKDHAQIIQAMIAVYMVDKLPITITSVLKRMGEDGSNGDYLHYLSSLETALHGYYRVREFSPLLLTEFATMVDKAGNIYRASAKSHKVAKLIESPEEFAKAVNEVADVTEWLLDYVSSFSALATPKQEGYQHISVFVERAKHMSDRIYEGEQLLLLPVGMPSIRLPLGKLVVLMAESNSGKSTVSLMWALGAAIGMKRHGIPGCCAINSMEMDAETLAMNLAGILASVDLFNFKFGTGITPKEKYRLDRAYEYVSILPIYLDPTNLLQSSVMEYRLTGLHASDVGPVYHLNIDYMELFDINAENKDNKEQALDIIIHKAFQISRQTLANVLMLSQVSQGKSGNPKARIAGPDGTRYSSAIRHAADLLYELWNPVEMRRAGIDFVVPANLNGDQPFLLCSKHRGGPKYDPVPIIWEPWYQRMGDIALNSDGNVNLTLFEHPLPSFEMVESGAF